MNDQVSAITVVMTEVMTISMMMQNARAALPIHLRLFRAKLLSKYWTTKLRVFSSCACARAREAHG